MVPVLWFSTWMGLDALEVRMAFAITNTIVNRITKPEKRCLRCIVTLIAVQKIEYAVVR